MSVSLIKPVNLRKPVSLVKRPRSGDDCLSLVISLGIARVDYTKHPTHKRCVAEFCCSAATGQFGLWRGYDGVLRRYGLCDQHRTN